MDDLTRMRIQTLYYSAEAAWSEAYTLGFPEAASHFAAAANALSRLLGRDRADRSAPSCPSFGGVTVTATRPQGPAFTFMARHGQGVVTKPDDDPPPPLVVDAG